MFDKLYTDGLFIKAPIQQQSERTYGCIIQTKEKKKEANNDWNS